MRGHAILCSMACPRGVASLRLRKRQQGWWLTPNYIRICTKATLAHSSAFESCPSHRNHQGVSRQVTVTAFQSVRASEPIARPLVDQQNRGRTAVTHVHVPSTAAALHIRSPPLPPCPSPTPSRHWRDGPLHAQDPCPCSTLPTVSQHPGVLADE